MIDRQTLLNPGKEYRVDVRWWLAEGFHTAQTLQKDIQMLDEAGFGAIEFLAMVEPGADSKLYGWGSEEWVHDSHTILEATTARGMGFSMTSGTNWANANLISICPDDKAAAKELDFVEEELQPGQRRTGAIPQTILPAADIHQQELVAVVAARVLADSPGCLAEDPLVLTEQVVEGTLDWLAPSDGAYKVFYFWLHGTGQIARPSVATSYTVNYMDPYGVQAFIDYWDREVLTDTLRDTIRRNGRGMMYMDSLELSTFGRGGQLWGYHLLEEFQRRRGYDLTPWLPFVVRYGSFWDDELHYYYHLADEIRHQKLLNDLYQTMTDCYTDHMLRPMQAWLHQVGLTLRAEVSYGLPFEASQAGKYVDGVETESLEFASQIDSYRNLSGTAHVYDRVFSSETGATRLNYVMGLDFYTQIIYAQFAAGVSRTVLHGYSSIAGSEDSTYWPGHEGMWPIFSERFGCRQPAWQHYRDWTDAMARYQMLIRSGKPQVDLVMLRLDYHLNNAVWAEDEAEQYAHELMRGNDALYWRDMTLQNAGYTWEYIAPQLLEEDFATGAGTDLFPEGPAYQALVIYQEELPLAAARRLLTLAEQGRKMVFVNGVSERVRMTVTRTHHQAACRSPFLAESDAELQALVRQIKAQPSVRETSVQAQTIDCLQALGVYPRARFAEPNPHILTFMSRDAQETHLFVYHMGYAQPASQTVTLEIAGGGRPYQVDCWNAEIHPLSGQQVGDRTQVTLTLMPGEATMLVLDRQAAPELLAAQKVYDQVIPLPVWDLTVEDWDEGPKRTVVEDRGLGIVTHEVYYETTKTPIPVGRVPLKPWRDYPQVGPDVSGVGYYTTTVTLPEDWPGGAELRIGSTNGNTVAVWVNGQKARAMDFTRRRIDISELLTAGENELRVEVSSTLTNRLLARDYYRKTAAYSQLLSDEATNAHISEETDPDAGQEHGLSMHAQPPRQDYGMTGDVALHLYHRS